MFNSKVVGRRNIFSLLNVIYAYLDQELELYNYGKGPLRYSKIKKKYRTNRTPLFRKMSFPANGYLANVHPGKRGLRYTLITFSFNILLDKELLKLLSPAEKRALNGFKAV